MLQSHALDIIASHVADCERCPELAKYRRENNFRTVPGEGHPNARLMLLGEAPGQQEAISGRPFVGRSGMLLDRLLTRAGIGRKDVFVNNILCCRPPHNRPPTAEEASNCSRYLRLRIDVIKPEWILCLGKTPTLCLLDPGDDEGWHKRSLGSFRGQIHTYRDIKVVCTYHPRFLLRSPENQEDFLDDLKLIKGPALLP